MQRNRKGKIRWGTLGAVASAVGGVVLTIASDPAVIATAAGKCGVSAAVLGAVIAGVKKAVAREDHER